jgi:glucose/arabinose dehydrogenase
LYVVQHGRDQLHSLWPDLFTEEQNAELPAEEFLLVEKGDDFGWPYGYYDPIQGKRVLAPEYGGDGVKVGPCEQFEDPILAFPAHWAPNDLMFYEGTQFPEKYRGGAFIAFHGSWNRAPLPQKGFKVVFVPFEGKLPQGKWDIFADGFAGTQVVRSVRDARYRPMGLAEGPDGSLYIADSKVGRIWRILYTGEQE